MYPPIPADETVRLAVLRAMGLLDAPPDERLDRITRTAARLFGVPIALISLVDADRQWFASCLGLAVRETGREVSFCAHAVARGELLVVEDALADPRFAANPLVTGAPYIRFYAGQPIRSADGLAVGTLCVIDRTPRAFGEGDREALRDLAAWAERELAGVEAESALRWQRAAEETRRRAEGELHTLSLIASSTDNAVILTDRHGRVEWVNDGFTRITGYALEEVAGRKPGEVLQGPGTDPDTVARISAALAAGQPVTEELLNYTRDGRPYWIEVRIKPIYDAAGAITHFLAIESDVTERHEAAAALRAERDFALQVMGALGQGITVVDADLRFEYVNPAYSRMFGYSAEELVGRSPLDLADPDQHERMILAHRQILAGETTSYEGVRRRADGRALPTFITLTPRWKDGRVTGVIGVTTDLSELRAAEDALAASERRFRALATYAPVGIILTDARGGCVFVNDRWQEISGLSAEEARGHGWWRAVHPEDMLRIINEGRAAGQEGRELALENRFQRPDGGVRWVYGSTVPLTSDDGRTTGYVGTMIDITERKQAEEALRRSEARQRALLDLIPDLMLRIGRDDRFVDYKAPRGAELIAPPEVFLGKTTAEVLPPPIAQQTASAIAQARRSREVVVYEYELPERHGPRDYEARVVASEGDEVLVIVRDITDRKAVDRMKSEFVATVSHELRTPLTSIRGALGLIAGGVAGDLPAQVRGMIDIAYKNSERLVRLINDILDIEKIESGAIAFACRPQPVLPIVAQAVEANAPYAAEFGVRVRLEPGPDDALADVDADRLTQVVTNLLSNAVKFSPRGEEVTVTLARDEGRLRLLVVDRGPGIPEAFRERVFQKFAQADSSSTRRQGGTGLGLSIVRAIVERLGGAVSFTIEAGRGTTFAVDLPEWRPAAAEAAPVVTSPLVLLADLEPAVAAMLADGLRQSGYTPATARTPDDVIGAPSVPAAVVVDLARSFEGGAGIVRAVRGAAATRGVPIVVISATADGYTGVHGDAFALVDWLAPPLDGTRLAESVRRAIRSHTAGRPTILHIEDDADVVQVVRTILAPVAEVVAAPGVRAARQVLARHTFDLAILDLWLPDGSGLELLPDLRDRGGRTLPVVVFSASELDAGQAGSVAAALVKSRTTNQTLFDTIAGLIDGQQQAHQEGERR